MQQHQKKHQSLKTWLCVIVVIGLVCAAAGYVFRTGLDAAFGAVPANASVHQHRCVNMHQDPCPPPDKWAAKKFRHGKMGRVHGFNEHRLFKNPRTARKVIIRKIDRALSRHHARPMYRGKALSAAGVYEHLRASASCTGHGSYSPYSYGFDLCYFDGPKVTTDDIKNMGTTIFCVGGAGLGIALAPETASASAWLVAGWGASACAWGAWIAASD